MVKEVDYQYDDWTTINSMKFGNQIEENGLTSRVSVKEVIVQH